ncbi:MAG: hypothetical protein KDA93_24390 [Planctomycetaceae bacterium]|nr:hypothetical protein [Planctomycetaceae bacterium]
MSSLSSASKSLMDQMIAFELGDLDEAETVSLFQQLIDDGTVWRLQGSYGRMAQQLIETGRCLLAPVSQRDYFGNVVPGRHDIEPGQPGTGQFVQEQQLSSDDLPFDPLS